MRSKRALIISAILALAAVLLIYMAVQKKVGYYSEKYKQLPVVVAAKNIPQNTIIDESMLGIKMVPAPYIEPNAILEDTAKVADKRFIAAITIKEGEQINEQKLLRPEAKISGYIPKGKRALTIAINEVTGVAGLIRPGDKIDIIGVFKTLEEKTKVVGNAESITILQNVEVLSIGRNYMFESFPSSSKDKSEPAKQGEINFSNITLLLTPREAMDLTLAQELGTLTLTLRSQFDDTQQSVNPELKNQRSNPSSVTGIKEKIDISPGPKWLEQRGERSLWTR